MNQRVVEPMREEAYVWQWSVGSGVLKRVARDEVRSQRGSGVEPKVRRLDTPHEEGKGVMAA